MDVSPRELRDTDIREAFRGYHRDDVDELLERAAATIEGLSERVRQITERISDAESSAGRNREAEETLQRTLILAQRTADAAVADARERAREMLDEAETKSRTLVTEAETSARRIADEEHRAHEEEVLELAARRETLVADIDALETFESEYRQRIRSTIQADLDSLGRAGAEGMPRPRPPVHEVEIPPAPDSVAVAGSGGETAAPSGPGPRPFPPASTPAPAATDAFAQLGAEDEAPDDAAQWGGSAAVPKEPAEPAGSSEPAPTPGPGGGGQGLAAYVADEPIEAEVLDDDAFFASLRDAVRDDAPLDLREDASSESFFDQEQQDSGRRRFRRRR
jgi:DivIVA domain-containing protein